MSHFFSLQYQRHWDAVRILKWNRLTLILGTLNGLLRRRPGFIHQGKTYQCPPFSSLQATPRWTSKKFCMTPLEGPTLAPGNSLLSHQTTPWRPGFRWCKTYWLQCPLLSCLRTHTTRWTWRKFRLAPGNNRSSHQPSNTSEMTLWHPYDGLVIISTLSQLWLVRIVWNCIF